VTHAERTQILRRLGNIKASLAWFAWKMDNAEQTLIAECDVLEERVRELRDSIEQLAAMVPESKSAANLSSDGEIGGNEAR
jgi:hypothetical protein